MEFVAKKIDLDLELTVLSGEKHSFEVRVHTDLKSLLTLVKKWDKINEVNNELEEDKLTPFELHCDRLVELYGETRDWWLTNCDAATINDITRHVAQTIGGVKKSEPN